MCYQSKHLAWALAGQRGRGVHTKLSRPHHDSQLGVPIVLDDAAAMPHFRSRSYLCTQHDYPLSAPQLLAETESS